MSFMQPNEIAQAATAIGKKKGDMPLLKLITLGILAGAFIAFAAMAATTAGSGWTEAMAGSGPAKALSAAAFTVGLIMVVCAGAELFTGNNMYLTLAMLEKETTWSKLGINWGLVFITNFIGAILLVGIVYFGGFLFSNGELSAYGMKALGTATTKMSLSWTEAFVRGIGCNWLVCVAVWISLGSSELSGKIVGCFFPIFTFVICGFEHSIANMFFIPQGILAAQGGVAGLTFGHFITGNLIPVTLGNIVGGAVFVAMFYWFAYLRKTKRSKDILCDNTTEGSSQKNM